MFPCLPNPDQTSPESHTHKSNCIFKFNYHQHYPHHHHQHIFIKHFLGKQALVLSIWHAIVLYHLYNNPALFSFYIFGNEGLKSLSDSPKGLEKEEEPKTAGFHLKVWTLFSPLHFLIAPGERPTVPHYTWIKNKFTLLDVLEKTWVWIFFSFLHSFISSVAWSKADT